MGRAALKILPQGQRRASRWSRPLLSLSLSSILGNLARTYCDLEGKSLRLFRSRGHVLADVPRPAPDHSSII